MGKGLSIFGVLLVVFAVWVVIAQDNEHRLERVCRPTLWMGNVAVSLTELIGSDGADSVQAAFNRFDYGCRYTIWRLLFEKDYLKAVKDGRIKPANASATQGASK